MSGLVLLIPVCIALLIAAPLLIFTFLIFPNIDGVLQDISWYNYDDMSQHFLYWFFFWGVAGGGALGTLTLVKSSS